ncbi:hypothetical protein RZN05_01760 [Sphingomonas sp. HF-S4]|uniref:Uncharacterized protein n=1 Tax=Sphingomonas agrestis TaxID=3080540 RepID=A0ABU3Y2U0_9SPHN|nr:hypothetical protein [Sphingomonas sp. HF-S4]MDV3455694.1 hypothetical protein [Sphingomonas sp. HF-S4]
MSGPGAQASPPPQEIHVDSAAQARPRGRFPAFPTERAERGIEAVSRFAGPTAFFLALGGVVWWMTK